MSDAMLTEKILGMNVNPLTYERATDIIDSWTVDDKTRFVSVSSVNNVVCAMNDPSLMDIQNRADMVTTDGMPLVFILKNRGYSDCSRVYGPTLTLHVLERCAEKGTGIYLFGCTDDVLDILCINLKAKYPKLVISGRNAPPFRPLTDEENQAVIDDIHESGAKIVLVGLSTPKQEQWMYRNRELLQGVVMIGVGAAFLFHADKVRQAPPLLQKMGLEWFFRLLMEPKRLWRRYLYGNSFFLWRLFLDRTGIQKA
jgi:N-acetylglucosaminyldiphosphoundecaprenol N-acetyl-beta-D-mannosaminyltransferase